MGFQTTSTAKRSREMRVLCGYLDGTPLYTTAEQARKSHLRLTTDELRDGVEQVLKNGGSYPVIKSTN